MPASNRRVFMLQVVATGAAVAASRGVLAADMVKEDDATAKSLGYVSETAKADKTKFPKHNPAAEKCGTCALFQGKAGEAAGACPLFAGKQVSAGGWCSAWAKKAA